MAVKNIGSDFDDFLEEEGLLEEVMALAIKRYIAFNSLRKCRRTRCASSIFDRHE